MFTKQTQIEPTELDLVISDLLSQMKNTSAETKEYAQMADQLTKLCKLKEMNAPKKLSPDVIATIAANLLGIVAVLQYERMHVVTSKALSFVMRLK